LTEITKSTIHHIPNSTNPISPNHHSKQIPIFNESTMLKDFTLLHREAYINGEWTAASSGKTFPVTNPPPAMNWPAWPIVRPGNPTGHRSRRSRTPGMARQNRHGAGRNPAQMARSNP